MQILSFESLDREEIVHLARQQADSGEPCSHGYRIGSMQACTWEHAFQERRRELDDQRAEV